ncbi:LOW QUALITY PROTEIN: RNA polymerase II subunit A C-terminal domain phosphatase-like [Lampetra fluviatilis]
MAEAGVVRVPGTLRAVRLLEWKVAPGSAVRMGSVVAHVAAVEDSGGGGGRDEEDAATVAPEADEAKDEQAATTVSPGRSAREVKLKASSAGVVVRLCCAPGQIVASGGELLRLEACRHPIVMKGLCAECGQDLRRLAKAGGQTQVSSSAANISMVHSVPELMVTSEQAESLGREDQQRLLRSRKLVLMVDLDQTLIHTTEQSYPHMSSKGIFHFQLGQGQPMLHTRLRPHCRSFLQKIAELYELHVFTFGSRLYAHTIAGFLDPEKKLFSHRILSRDECIDPYCKTGNLKNLFPCGDSMVCIIDDREDVWRSAPNLIAVRKYVYFQGTGDINAPPGSREAQRRGNNVAKVTPESSSQASAESPNAVSSRGPAERAPERLAKCPPAAETDGSGKATAVAAADSRLKPAADRAPAAPTNNGTGRCGGAKDATFRDGAKEPVTAGSTVTDDGTAAASLKEEEEESKAGANVADVGAEPRQNNEKRGDAGSGAQADLDFDLSSDSDSPSSPSAALKEESEAVAPPTHGGGDDDVRTLKADVKADAKVDVKVDVKADAKTDAKVDAVRLDAEMAAPLCGGVRSGRDAAKEEEAGGGEERLGEAAGPCVPACEPEVVGENGGGGGGGAGGGVETRHDTVDIASQNTEQSGITEGESFEPEFDVEEEEGKAHEGAAAAVVVVEAAAEVDDKEEDDYLLHLEEVLSRVHAMFYVQQDRWQQQQQQGGGRQGESEPAGAVVEPDLRSVVPELRRSVLRGVVVVFSGVFPTNCPADRTREYRVASALGAIVSSSLVLDASGAQCATTHLVAAKAGTDKVRRALESRRVRVVTPDWLWACADRWDHVEECLFTLTEGYTRTHRSSSPATYTEAGASDGARHALLHPTPMHPRGSTAPAPPEARVYDPVTGRLLRKGSVQSCAPGASSWQGQQQQQQRKERQERQERQLLQQKQQQQQVPSITPAPAGGLGHDDHSPFRCLSQQQVRDAPEGSRRQRQPSMSEALPLYTLSKDDLDSMDKEVDDILGEESDGEEEEEQEEEVEEEEEEETAEKAEVAGGSSARSGAPSVPEMEVERGAGGRAPPQSKEELGTLIERPPSSSSGGSLEGSVPRGHKRRRDESEEEEEEEEELEGSSSEADEMAAALDAELDNFM